MMGDTVTLSRQAYEDLVDARDHALAMRDVAAGAMEVLSEAEMDDYLAATTPLAFWRRNRGLTQAAMAESLGISQPYWAQIENGRRSGTILLLAKAAKIMRLRMEDLVAD